jgi:hypothetical protein
VPFTLISDVTTGYLGDVPPDDYLTSKIDEVELILARRLGDLQVWADSDLRARALRVVVARAVRRALSNPMNARSVTEAIGPMSRSYTLDLPGSGKSAGGAVTVTDDDWALLGVGVRKPGTIKLGSSARRPAGPDYWSDS